MSAVASSVHPYRKHLTMRTTVASGSLLYSRSVPRRSLKRWPQLEQYNRRMCLSLPVHSTTLRLPAAKRLKSQQSGLGQARSADAGSVERVGVLGDVRWVAMAGLPVLGSQSRYSDRTSHRSS